MTRAWDAVCPQHLRGVQAGVQGYARANKRHVVVVAFARSTHSWKIATTDDQ